MHYPYVIEKHTFSKAAAKVMLFYDTTKYLTQKNTFVIGQYALVGRRFFCCRR